MDFEDILHRLKIESLNDMQRQTVAALLGTKDDLVLLSPTGTGKTLAYMLPLTQMIDPSSDSVQAVVIVPSRELAIQSGEVFRSLGCGLRSQCLYGGRPAMDEHREMRKTMPQVVFCTPGRLNDHIDKGNILTNDIRTLVIDEFDKCLQMGFMAEMQDAVGKMRNVRRRILLSATDTDEIPTFVNMDNARRIDVLGSDDVPDRISTFVVKSEQKDKIGTLTKLLCCLGEASSIVFVNYRDSVERVSEMLRSEGFVLSSFHGGLDQKQREDAIYKFSNGSANILVSTDLASRGLDIPEVDNIIHYHLPIGEDEYTHRIGRTARWEAKGNVFFILSPGEQLPDFVTCDTEDYTIPDTLAKPSQPKMVTLYIGKGKKDKISKGDVLGFLCKSGGLNGSDIGRIDVMARCSYAAVNRKKYKDVIQRASGEKLKGIKTIVELVK